MGKGFRGEKGMGNAGQKKNSSAFLLQDFFETYTMISIGDLKGDKKWSLSEFQGTTFILERILDLVFYRT